MKYKLIAIDMDGTFLNEERQITERNLKAVKKAVELGTKVVISSGRIPSALRYIIKDMPKNQPIIACNGSIILDHNHNEIAYGAMDNNSLITMIDILRNDFKDTFFSFFSEDIIYSEKLHPFAEKFNEYNLTLPVEYRMELKMIRDAKDFILESNPRISKFEIYDDNSSNVNAIRARFETLFDIEIVSSGLNGIEITNKGLSKGSSLEVLAKHYGYSLEECIAVGNDENDIEMIKKAGLGIAVCNAKDYVKSVANYITIRDNDHDAISEVIEKFVV
ncbi:Cof-type HAD-IIB family hydrolase [Clostridium folliculivorans]|uniref:Haloacid dehalogenase n=1 Tax=Clostridium folliculivorans TaxID=2886038 RepID=A0A9W5Y1D1_9CLOT|nr:Cof-type HAD-IIB family hydrolase [Clostridium folliculivorans]GKU24697.1 haloacid dehalogenase [Clostridium folliculivorans]GKU30795.1 haloacid dehalogenase [Clostridium folliculivorans]